MENEKVVANRPERGCLLTGALVLSLLGAIFSAFFCGVYVIANTPERMGEVQYWVFVVFTLVNIYAVFLVLSAFKMKKAPTQKLLLIMVLTTVIYIFGAFSETPVTDEQKSGAGSMLLFAIVTALCAVIIALNLKKMK